jgi:sterol desaturase/sphingolipid hydroxylase (fatty acid hydroxylase superfamily)
MWGFGAVVGIAMMSWFAAVSGMLGDRLTFVFFMTVADAIPFLVLSFALETTWGQSRAAKYRICPDKKVNEALNRETKGHACFEKLVSPIFYLLTFGLERWWNPDVVSTQLPSLWIMAMHFLVCVAVEDTLLYWMHRLVHHPALYSWIHKKHHEVKVTTSWAAVFGWTFDKVLTGIIPAFAGAWLTRCHVIPRALHLFCLVIDTWVGHSGYDFPFMPWRSAKRHYFHHSGNVGNYGLKFGFWDWLMGTDTAYSAWVRSLN